MVKQIHECMKEDSWSMMIEEQRKHGQKLDKIYDKVEKYMLDNNKNVAKAQEIMRVMEATKLSKTMHEKDMQAYDQKMINRFESINTKFKEVADRLNEIDVKGSTAWSKFLYFLLGLTSTSCGGLVLVIISLLQ